MFEPILILCKHHWMCEATVEGVTPARCKLCVERRTFRAKHPLDDLTASEAHSKAVLTSRARKGWETRRQRVPFDAPQPELRTRGGRRGR